MANLDKISSIQLRRTTKIPATYMRTTSREKGTEDFLSMVGHL